MTCRHSPGDPACGSWRMNNPAPVESPDPKDFHVLDAEEVDGHLILKVRYPSCKKCSFEGDKILVFAQTTALQALRWKEIDPHFRAKSSALLDKAPSPCARFPASSEGMEDARLFVRAKKASLG